jgi:hypothetical protein
MLALLADILSAVLDSGITVSAMLIFFFFQYPKNSNIGIDTYPGVVGEYHVAQHRRQEEDATHCARRQGHVQPINMVDITVFHSWVGVCLPAILLLFEAHSRERRREADV